MATSKLKTRNVSRANRLNFEQLLPTSENGSPTAHNLRQAARALLGAAIAFRDAKQPIDARRVLLASLDVSYRRRCLADLATIDLPEGSAVDYARRLQTDGGIDRREFDLLVSQYDQAGPLDWKALERLFDLARAARDNCLVSIAKVPPFKPARTADQFPESARFIKNNYDGTALVSVIGLFEVQIRPGNEPLAQMIDREEADDIAREYNLATIGERRFAVAVPMDGYEKDAKGGGA